MQKTATHNSAAEQLITIQLGSWAWVVLPQWRPLLDHIKDLCRDSLGHSEDASLIKENDLRSVWRVRLGDDTVIAKVYPKIGRLKKLLVGPPGWREFRAGVYGKRNNLSVVRPIAFGRHAGRNGCVLLTEQIPNARSLSTYWRDQAASSGRRRVAVDSALVTKAAAFLERLHRGNFVPADLHPDNILVNESEDLVLVDLHKARCGVRPNKVLRILNLADVNQWFSRHASRATRLRFLLAYLTYAVEKPSPRLIRKYVTEINEVTGWKAEKLEKKRDRRIFGDNSYFATVTLPDEWSAHVYLRGKRPVSGSPCSEFEFAKSDWTQCLTQLLTDGEPAAAGCPAQIRVGPHDVAVRVDRVAGSPKPLRQRWECQHKKINRHESVPLPLALLERRSGPKGSASLLITERSETA